MRPFAFSKRACRAKKERSLSPYLRRAKRLLNLCIRQNDLRLTNPELFTPLQPVARSPLKWTGKKAELYELLIALDNLDIITENGVKASSPPSSGSSPAQWACLTTQTATTSAAGSSPGTPAGRSSLTGSKRRDSKMMKFFLIDS